MNTTPRSDTVAQSGQSQDLASAMVNMKVQAQVFDSSAKVVKTADETIGTLLDVRA